MYLLQRVTTMYISMQLLPYDHMKSVEMIERAVLQRAERRTGTVLVVVAVVVAVASSSMLLSMTAAAASGGVLVDR